MAQEYLRQRITTRIRQLEKRRAAAIIQHFTPHYPRYHDGQFRLDCWCGSAFCSPCLDTVEITRMLDFVNEHAACQPKEPA